MPGHDRLDLARNQLAGAADELEAAAFALPELRPEIAAEIAVLRRSMDRIRVLQRRHLRTGWSRAARYHQRNTDNAGADG